MKKISLATLLLSSITVCYAHNFYIGANINTASQTVKSKQIYPVSSSAPSYAATNIALNTIGAGMVIAYQRSFTQHWGMAPFLKLSLNMGSNTRKIDNWFNNNNVAVKISTPYTLGLTAAAFYQWRPDVRFLFGPTITETSFISKSSYSAGNIGPSGDFKVLLPGYGLSFGIGYTISPRFRAQLVDTYTLSNHVKWTATEPLSEESLSQDYQLYSNQVQLNLLWAMKL